LTPWGTLLITGLQLDFVPLITSLWAWPFRQFSIHLPIQPILQQLLCKDLMGDNVESLTEVYIDTTYCSLVYQASHFITVHHVDQA